MSTPRGIATIAPEQAEQLQQYLSANDGFRPWLFNAVYQPVANVFEGNAPKKLKDLYESVVGLENSLRQSREHHIGKAAIPVVRRALLHYRYQQALRQERLLALSVDSDHAQEIAALTRNVDYWLSLDWVQSVEPLARPRLTDYVNLQTARQILAKGGATPSIERVYDEKFGILWAPTKFTEAIEAARTESWLLRTSTCVAYVDIDDFKAVNTRLTEIRVDGEVLPPFMMLLEAHTSSRGYAFRYGGDEYVILLPNVDQPAASASLELLRAAIDQRMFGDQKITTSIGFIVVPDDCPLTNTEILQHANRAKNAAKANGKNRVEQAQV